MASKKMTFTIPASLALRFTKRVPARERSRFVAAALTAGLSAREERLVRSCEAANNDADVRRIESEFDQLPDTVERAWKRGS